MKIFLKYTFIAIVFFTLTTCKKYDEGGFVKQTRLHLFGGHKVGSSKTWKLKLFEVNGIDSTNLILNANNIPDFYNKFITFSLKDKKFMDYSATTFLYNIAGEIDLSYHNISVGPWTSNWTKEDSTQCFLKNSIYYCSRNIFLPEIQDRAFLWNIKKLTKNQFILTVNAKNSYKIILTQ